MEIILSDGEILELRQIKAKDIFTLSRLIRELELIEPVKNIFEVRRPEIVATIVENQDEETPTEQLTQQLGASIMVEFIEVLIDRLPKAEKQVNAFLGGLVGKSASEIEELPLSDFIELLTAFLTHEDFKQAFGLVSQSMQ